MAYLFSINGISVFEGSDIHISPETSLNYATQQYVDEAILSALAEYAASGEGDGGQINFDTFIRDSNINEYISNWYSNYAEQIYINMEGYATQDWVDEKLKNLSVDSEGNMLDLSEYAKTIDIQNWVNSQNYATQQWVLNKGYLTELDFSNYVDKDYLDTYTSNMLEGYATVDYVSSLFDGTTDESFATKGYVKGYVDRALENLTGGTYVPGTGGGTVDLTGYAKESWVLQQINNVNTGVSVDLSNYYTKNEIASYVKNNTIQLISLTQAEYNSMPDYEKKKSNTLYNIIDAELNYYTKEEINRLLNNGR